VSLFSGVKVVDGALKGREPEVYARDDLLPTLQSLIML
jgi:hypothetical protein